MENYFIGESKYAAQIVTLMTAFKPRSEKTGLRGFRFGPIQTGLYRHRRWLEA